jgi:hypothetical protein
MVSDIQWEREYREGRERAPATRADMDGLRADLVAIYNDVERKLAPLGKAFAVMYLRHYFMTWAFMIIGLTQTALLAWIASHMR